jgi:hypothetical protein
MELDAPLPLTSVLYFKKQGPQDKRELSTQTNACSACDLEARAYFRLSCSLVAEAKWFNHSLQNDVFDKLKKEMTPTSWSLQSSNIQK